MTKRFIPAEDLKKSYDVFGHFYSVELASQEVVHCRSVLEVAEKSSANKDYAELSQRQPNAVFVMMNPGSSKPLMEVDNYIHVRAIHNLPISLVPTKPDTTQYQVMRLMHYRQWQHVRVLNLSDLRCSKSAEFVKLYRRLEEDADFDSHSIFSAARKHELSAKLPKSKKTPLVLAWGLSDKLNPLIERCLSSIPLKQTIYGLLQEGTTNKYRHPLPSLQRDKRAWLDKMVRQCKE
jgi:hypothetical protein